MWVWDHKLVCAVEKCINIPLSSFYHSIFPTKKTLLIALKSCSTSGRSISPNSYHCSLALIVTMQHGCLNLNLLWSSRQAEVVQALGRANPSWTSLIPRPPPFFVLRFAFSIPCIILNANWRTKNGGGLGTRLEDLHIKLSSTATQRLHHPQGMSWITQHNDM